MSNLRILEDLLREVVVITNISDVKVYLYGSFGEKTLESGESLTVGLDEVVTASTKKQEK